MVTLGCGIGLGGFVYFLTFILVVKLIFLNLFVAIILEGYFDTNQKDKGIVNADIQYHFKQCWAKYDPFATGFMSKDNLKSFLFNLGPPLGWDASYRSPE